MRFYQQQHEFYCGVDLHSNCLHVCVVDADGHKLLHRNFENNRLDLLLARLQPYRQASFVLACESTFNWYWLFDADFPALLMDITRHVVREFDLDLSELHNDSTTVRFFGDYDGCEQPQPRRGKITAAIRHGHSKDHRPDLKQLLYILTLTDDGGVPVYFTTDDGDKNDDQTHGASDPDAYRA